LAALNWQINEQHVVLIVHDREMLRGLAVEALRRDGHTVLAAECGEHGLQISRAYHAPIHLALTALQMQAGMDGLQFCDQIAFERPGIRLAVMSRSMNDAPIAACAETIPEPFSVLQFRHRVRELLGLHEHFESLPDSVLEGADGPRGLRLIGPGPGGIMYDPNLAHGEMMAAGQRLLDALRLEDEFTRIYADHPVDEVLHRWREARRLVERLQQDYDDSMGRLREAVRTGASQPEPSVSKTVLLLEDDRMISTLLKTTLEQQDYRVLQAGNGEEATALFEHHPGKIDLMIADVILRSGTYGMGVAQRLLELRPEVPVLFISGYPAEELTNRGLLDTAAFPFRKAAFLQKPFSPTTLEAHVRDLID
jgi:CheY-like chemotaxis protein